MSETTTVHNAFRGRLWNIDGCRLRPLCSPTEQSCRVYEANASKQSEMAQELALCWDGDEGMVSGLSPRDGRGRFRLLTDMAHAGHSAFFKVALYRQAENQDARDLLRVLNRG